jgi:voltage-dependent potassium channel beta subunit
MRVFRRKGAGATDSTAQDSPGTQGPDSPADTVKARPAAEAGKGRPTPTRKQAEAGRYQPISGSRLPSGSRRQSGPRTAEDKAKDKAERVRRSEAMKRGEDWALTARDKGPARALVRDYVDSKRRISEYYMFVLVALLVVLVAGSSNKTIAPYISYFVLLMIVVMALDGMAIRRGLARLLAERMPGTSTRGLTWYAVSRSMWVRRFRVPAPRVGPGDEVLGLADMEYRHLGKSGLVVSEIAYGNWITHGSQVEEDAAAACVRAALDAGVTTFDTADVYASGRAEEVLGRALAGVRRESLEICTKVYWPMGSGKNDRGLSRKHIVEGVHASLRRLGTDYIDLYQAHRYDHQTPLEETMRAFDDLVRQGKVLYVGVSEWRAPEIEAALRIAADLGLDRIVSNQPQYNMLWRVIEAEVVPLCEKEGLGQIVWSPIAQGVLTGKYLPGAAVPERSRATDASGSRFIGRLLTPPVLEAVQGLRPLAEEAGLSMAQLAVAWTLQNPSVSAAIIGATRPEQVAENVAAAGVRLDEGLMARIDQVLGAVIERDPAKTGSPPARP